MADLLFESWSMPDGAECSRVSESWDKLREPDARLVARFRASTYGEAMQQHYDLHDFGAYTHLPGTTDILFTDAELAEQEAYLKVRPATEPLTNG